MVDKTKELEIDNIIRETIHKIQLDKRVHRVKIEVEFVNFAGFSQELIKPNRIKDNNDIKNKRTEDL